MSTGVNALLRISTAGTGNSGGLDLAVGTTVDIKGLGNNDMVFFTNNSEKMRITTTGNVGIGTASPDASAKLDISSTTQGFLQPRMTTAQRDAISSPADGLGIYNATVNKFQGRANGAWVDLH